MLPLLLAVVLAQDSPPRTDRSLEPRDDSGSLPLAFSTGGHARASFPFGRIGDFTATSGATSITFDDDVSYRDLLRPGPGFDLELSIGFSPQPPASMVPPGAPPIPSYFGLYGAILWDRFDGDREDDSTPNISVATDDLSISTFIVGLKAGGPVDTGLFGDFHIGVGASRFSALDATFTNGVTTFTTELFQSSTEFLAEARFRLGLRIGPLTLTAGSGIRVASPPNAGSDLTLDPGAFWAFDIDVGLELGL